MIYVHSMLRAVRYFPERPALAIGEDRLAFRELHNRVKNIAAALTRVGFVPGDRLAVLLPNGPEYIKFVYACGWLGIIAVPINTRLSVVEIDHLLADANPRGLVRHSSLPKPNVRVSWERLWQIEPVLFTPRLIDLCDQAIVETSGKRHRMPSGPLHDAAEVARAGVPTVMMFVQSLHGISHNKIEDTREEHIEMAVKAFDRLVRLAISDLRA